MTELPVNPEPVIADPKRPYKAYLAFALAFATALYATLQGRPTLEGMKVMDWLIVILGAVVVAGGTYTIRNPKIRN